MYRQDLLHKQTPKSAEIHLVVYKTSFSVVCLYNMYLDCLPCVTYSLYQYNNWWIPKVQVLDTCKEQLNLDTRLI